MGAVEAGSRRLPVTATTPRQDGPMDRVRDYRAERWTSPQCFVTSPGNRGGEPWPAIPRCRSRAVRPHPCQPQPMEPSDGFGAGLDRRAEESPDRGTDGGEEKEDGAVTPPRKGTGRGPQAGEGQGWWAAGCVGPGFLRSPRAIQGPAIRLGASRKTSVPAAASRGELRPDPEIALPGGEALAEWAGSEAAHPAGGRPAGLP